MEPHKTERVQGRIQDFALGGGGKQRPRARTSTRVDIYGVCVYTCLQPLFLHAAQVT